MFRVRLDDGRKVTRDARRRVCAMAVVRLIGGAASWSSFRAVTRSRPHRSLADARARNVIQAQALRADSSHEGSTERQEDLRQVQDRPAPRRRARDLRQPAPQAAARLRNGVEMARIAGVDLPRRKHDRLRAPVHLRHRQDHVAQQICKKASIPRPKKVDELSEADVKAHPRRHRRRLQGRRRPAPRGAAEHQAPDGPRLLPRPPSPQGPAGPRPAHAHQRAHAQGPAQGHVQRRPRRSAPAGKPGG